MAATWTELLLYGVFLFVLLVKPSGLFGQKHDY
jgi:branched-chain amino acid transport system permease protein